MNTAVQSQEFYILDTETASLQGPPCELAFLRVDQDLNILEEYLTLVNPERPIDPVAQAVHGITDEQVKDAMTMAQVAELKFPFPIQLVAHNAQFDRRMITPHGVEVSHSICTLAIARANFTKEQVANHKLETLQKELQLPEQKSHSALGDVHTVRDFLLWLRDNRDLSFATLVARSREPKVVHTMPFGAHKGKLLTKLPPSYITWLLSGAISLHDDLKFSLERLNKL